jgi:DNA repair protein RadD
MGNNSNAAWDDYEGFGGIDRIMVMTPRAYQVEAVQSVFKHFASSSGNPVIAMPTGTGKSVVIAMLLQAIYYQWPNQRVILLTHVKELIEQNFNKLKQLWPSAPAGIYSSGLKRKEHNRPIVFGGIASVAKRAHLFGHVDLVLIDEAHLVSPNEETLYRKFLDDLLQVNPALKVVGLTATPWRLGQGHITEDGIFTDVCFDITTLHAFNRLIREGFMSLLIPRHTRNVLDVEGVHKRGGEFIASELQAMVDKLEITNAALNEALELGSERSHWLVFASGVEHADHIAEMLNDKGISAVSIHSKMPDAQRDQAILDFKSGKYRAAVNNNVLTTGFDFPEIDLIIVLRPTASTVLWVQMLGRGTRPAQGKENCLVLDFAGNTSRLGPINDPVLPRKKGEGTGEAPVKLCGACGVYNHASVKHCIGCGAEFTSVVKFKAEASSEDLVKSDMPITALFKVDHITYSEHEKLGRPPMMKLTYYCGIRAFSEYVCFEHEGFAGRKARQWWKLRTATEFPESTEQALERADTLAPATHLRVWVNKQYPEILSHCFDGTAFGEVAPVAAPSTDTHLTRKHSAALEEDDIPF